MEEVHSRASGSPSTKHRIPVTTNSFRSPTWSSPGDSEEINLDGKEVTSARAGENRGRKDDPDAEGIRLGTRSWACRRSRSSRKPSRRSRLTFESFDGFSYRTPINSSLFVPRDQIAALPFSPALNLTSVSPGLRGSRLSDASTSHGVSSGLLFAAGAMSPRTAGNTPS